MGKYNQLTRQRPSNYIGMLKLSPDIWIILGAISQLERELIAERVRNGLANARAKGIHIGRKKTRNSVLIRALLKKKLSYRAIAELTECSHGSIYAEKLEMLKEEAELKKKKEAEESDKKLLEEAQEESFPSGPELKNEIQNSNDTTSVVSLIDFKNKNKTENDTDPGVS